MIDNCQKPGQDTQSISRVDHKTRQLGQFGPQFLFGAPLDADAAVNVQSGQRGATALGQAINSGISDPPDAVKTQQLQFMACRGQFTHTSALKLLWAARNYGSRCMPRHLVKRCHETQRPAAGGRRMESHINDHARDS